MSSNDDALIEKAARALHERDMYDEWDSPECNQVPDNGGGSCKQDYLDQARAVLDAIGDDLRAEGWDTAIADATWSDGRWVTTGPIEAGMVNPYRRERA